MKKIYVLLLISSPFLFYNFLPAQTATLEATFSLQLVNGVYIPFQNGMPVPSFEKQGRQTIDLRGNWKKQRFAADDDITLMMRDAAGYSSVAAEAQNRFAVDFDDNSWESKDLPAVENTMYPFPKVPEYYEDGVWYRKKFTVPDSAKDMFVKLSFYAVNYVADVWLNGQYLGYHEGGYTPFSFDVSDNLNFTGENVLAVRIDNPEWGSRNDIVPYYEVDWFNYAGIIHDVYLEISNAVSILRADIVATDIDGNIQTTITVINRSGSNKNVDAVISVYEADVNETNIKSERAEDLIGVPAIINGAAENNFIFALDTVNVWRTILKIENPKLWSPKEPNLYVMKVQLKEQGKIIDEFHTQFGVRTIARSGDKVLLNGNVVFLTGVARHEDHPVYGRSVPLDTIYHDLSLVKGVNANMLRTGHYPNHLYTYLIADRLGITIVEEIPVWWFDEPLPWQIQNNQRHIHEQMFKEMIYKDFNRPSIILWSTQNESYDVPNRKIWIEYISSEVKNKIADGRLITQSAAADRPGITDDSQNACDVAGWTMYFGIFHGSEYYLGTNFFLVNAHNAFPDKPILDTEFGYWSTEQGTATATQVAVFNDTFAAFARRSTIKSDGTYDPNGYLMGITWWCIFDWYSHGHPEGFQSMGLYSMDRTWFKPVGQVLKDTYAPYFNMGGVVTGVEEKHDAIQPQQFNLQQNYPNPFNPSTVIAWQAPVSAHTTIKIYDILGKEAATILDEKKPAGMHEIEFDASALSGFSSGIYFYEVNAGGYKDVKKMVLIR